MTLAAMSGIEARSGRVAQGVDRAVGGDQHRRLGRRPRIRLARPAAESSTSSRCAAPGSTRACRCAAGVPEPASRDLGARQTQRRRERREHERHPVGDAAGGVLVDDGAAEVAEVHRLAGCHIARVIASVSPSPIPRHRQAIRNAAIDRRPPRRRVAGDQPFESSRGEDAPARLIAIASRGSHVILRTPARRRRSPSPGRHPRPGGRPRSCPRRRTSVRVPISYGPPGRPAASKGVRSRE